MIVILLLLLTALLMAIVSMDEPRPSNRTYDIDEGHKGWASNFKRRVGGDTGIQIYLTGGDASEWMDASAWMLGMTQEQFDVYVAREKSSPSHKKLVL